MVMTKPNKNAKWHMLCPKFANFKEKCESPM